MVRILDSKNKESIHHDEILITNDKVILVIKKESAAQFLAFGYRVINTKKA
ncbi:hypothetical protein GMB86_08725 [Terrilactibacillus sp. BCM23-1]|uniref:Uncharacterized protein n=1 Tax=Terrilactibacillus tamarindi TaxID=2599694 RepID=A0A6N8CPJ2_9BACI|nr:hypothetical protein [Terrilactibacillus tamarindi]MTT32089.1 hypothetical protein [Terrilactibacillus tamarindi]